MGLKYRSSLIFQPLNKNLNENQYCNKLRKYNCLKLFKLINNSKSKNTQTRYKEVVDVNSEAKSYIEVFLYVRNYTFK